MTEFELASWKNKRGAYRSEVCKQWRPLVLDNLKETVPMSKVAVVSDNAPCHTGLEDVFTEDNYSQRGLANAPVLGNVQSNRKCL